MDNRDIQFMQGTPINRLFFALNHYISTADHIGEGIALPVGGSRVKILVPYNPRELEDADNFRRLVARTDEIGDSIPGIRGIEWEEEAPMTPGGFRVMSFTIFEADCDKLATVLREKPGPMGWGSLKTLLDRYNWKEK